MEKDLESLILTTVDEASDKAFNSDTNMKALERDIHKELTNSYNSLRKLKRFYKPKAEIVEQIDQLLPKLEAEMVELFSPIQLTISAGELSTMGKKFLAAKSAIQRAARSNYVGEIATALAELYEKEKQRINLPKWEFVAKYMAEYLPQEYQRHESSDAPQAWKSLVRHHKRSD